MKVITAIIMAVSRKFLGLGGFSILSGPLRMSSFPGKTVVYSCIQQLYILDSVIFLKVIWLHSYIKSPSLDFVALRIKLKLTQLTLPLSLSSSPTIPPHPLSPSSTIPYVLLLISGHLQLSVPDAFPPALHMAGSTSFFGSEYYCY